MNLRIEIWMNENMEWSLEGDGSAEQYARAKMKVRSLFPDEEELNLVVTRDDVRPVRLADAIDEIESFPEKRSLMLCDKKYEKMMMFVYSE
ncbi:MAG TPA: hypothetical protein PKC29_14415 [Thermodesulfobacteriota bacterium]|nr:hypothetical protein [Thermodesulfobacteriota bacterium]